DLSGTRPGSRAHTARRAAPAPHRGRRDLERLRRRRLAASRRPYSMPPRETHVSRTPIFSCQRHFAVRRFPMTRVRGEGMVKFKQLILPGDVGSDVLAVKHALKKMGIGGSGAMNPSRRAGPAFVSALKVAQRQHSLLVDG